MQKLAVVSTSPHIRSNATTRKIMLDVLIALCPALIMSAVYFGFRTVILTAVCVGSCILFEYLSRRLMKRSQTIGDLSAAVTGMLLALNLPATLPLWMAVIGSAAAIIVVKQFFGGIGKNFVNPAITARIILMLSFTTHMSSWIVPGGSFFGIDAQTSATPLKAFTGTAITSHDLLTLLIGNHGGSMGETCAVALLLGGLYLVIRKVISPLIPLVFIGTVGILSFLLGGFDINYSLFHILSGGLLLGAIFMATDYTTSPITLWGKVVFALGCGIFTTVIRLYGNLPEGVSFSILLMNILVPLIENATASKPFGKERKADEKK